MRPASRRWEKNSSGSQLVHSSARLDRLDAGRAEQPPGDLGQVEHPPGGDPVAELGERGQDLVADLVAAGPDPGPDRGRGRADLLDPAGDDPGGQSAPAAVQHRDAPLAGERDRQAVGDLDQRRQRRVRGHLAVGVGGPGRPAVNGFGSGRAARGARAPRRGPESRTGRPPDRGRARAASRAGWRAPRPRSSSV